MLAQQISVKFGEKFIAHIIEDETMEASMTTQVISIVDMMIGMGAGMGAGMAAEPFMMKRIKRWRTGRKVNKMLNEITKNKKEDAETEEQPHENRAGLPHFRLYSQSAENSKVHPLLRLPGFVTILIVGLAIIGYGMTLPTLDPNWVIAIGIIFVIIAILAITVVR